MEMPKGWKRLASFQTYESRDKAIEENIQTCQLIKEMAEALEEYENDLEGIHYFNNGSSVSFRTNKAREVIKKFKEWK